MIGTYGSALLICGASVLIGRLVCVLAGHAGSSWLSAPVGFAGLMIVCNVAVRLPGRGWTAVVVVVVLCALAVWIPSRRGAGWPPAAEAAPVLVAVLLITCIPFVANARVGILGVSFLNDTHWHLILAEGLLNPSIQPIDGYGAGYPLGPHAVAATFAQGLGADVGETLTGVLIAVPLLTGLAALGALADLGRARRWLVAVLTAMPYLAAAAYAESAFKEPIMSLLLLGLVLALQAGRRARFGRPSLVIVPVAVLSAGVVYVYSYPGLAWPVAILACWLVAEIVLGGAWRRTRAIVASLPAALPAFAVGAVLLLVLIAPDLGRIYTFWTNNGGASAGGAGGLTQSPLANLAAPLRGLEGLNIWLTGDFRYVPADAFQAGVFAGFAGLVLIFAVLSSLERGELVWPAAMVGLAAIYLYAKHSQTPYVASKALTIPAPLLVLGSGGELMRRLDTRRWRSVGTLAAAGAAVAFFGLAFTSVSLALRDALVGPNDHIRELRSLRSVLHGRPTLVLVNDDYFQWGLLGVPAETPQPLVTYAPIPASIRPAKPFVPGQALDFDSVDAATLDRFDYVITTASDALSEPPPNFRLVKATTSYQAWQRVGPTQPRLVLPESGQAGAILDCRTPAAERVSREQGVARVRPMPRYVTVGSLLPGQSEDVVLDLPAGTWNLSLPFVSVQAVKVKGPGLDVRLPPNLDRPGNVWPIGRIRSSGAPMTFTVTLTNPGPISGTTPVPQGFAPQRMIAVPAAAARTVPLREACGRYVDWYELAIT